MYLVVVGEGGGVQVIVFVRNWRLAIEPLGTTQPKLLIILFHIFSQKL